MTPLGLISAGAAVGAVSERPTPQAACGPGSRPETSIQGRFPKAEFDDGSYVKGHYCNATQLGHVASAGGYRVERYVDKAGHECAYYDSTLLFPGNIAAPNGPGVYVLDMTNPAKPRLTDTLTTPAMLSPHESMRVNQKRGLIAAGQGSPGTEPAFVDVYDLTADCRRPVLKFSGPLGIFGHESAFAPDGKTFYVTGTAAPTLVAVDLTNPAQPSVAWVTAGRGFHGMNISNDGNTLYAADAGVGRRGLTILDVTQVQNRTLNPSVPEISHLTWPTVSIPQNADPFTNKGHHYLLEIDEYNSKTLNGGTAYDPAALIGAGRIIDIEDPKKPFVVSNLRLAVHETAARAGNEQNDPGASNGTQGYAGHYCSLPTRTDPAIVGCSMIASGLRLFDIRNPAKPIEVGYFNKPTSGGGFAMSAPAYVPARNEIWYTDGNSGFYALRLSGPARLSGVGTGPAAPPIAKPPATAPAPPSSSGSLPTTGLPDLLPWLGAAAVGLTGAGLAIRRRRT
ncbi:MAG: hypothetical protein NVSMB55_11260 [Mycobacteriales bacterium]